MMRKVILLVGFVLFCNLNLFSMEKLQVPVEFSENITVSGFDSDIFEYDFNKDGIKEKVLVNSKKGEFSVKAVISVYIMEDGKYRFAYQIPLKEDINIFSVKRAEDMLKKVKEHYEDYSKDLEKGEVRYVRLLDDNTNEQIVFDMKFDKHSPKDLDNFIFVKKTTVFNQSPQHHSGVAYTAHYKDKPRILLEFLSEKDNKHTAWYFTEMQEGKDKSKVKGYVSGVSGTIQRRGFYWDEMHSKIEKVNYFINNAMKDKSDLYIITQYRPLANDIYSEKDKFGNRRNQSITGYINPDKKGEIINIPDQTIFKIIGKENDMLKIETPLYGGPYYIADNPEIMKKWNLETQVNKFIAIDPNNQTEAVLQRIKDTNNFSIISYSFVTTGKDDGYSSYETPHGAFLIAFTRPYMLFTGRQREGDTRKSAGKEGLVIAGEAQYAVRFSGGAYMHGIPVSYGASASTKAYTASKIGTYKESHKCVRHYDDQIEFIVNWINGSSTTKERDNTIPDEPVIAVVL
ncbi:L,D-transpeptidase family protein [Pseudoleptotrichia goodfellowii]|uniref:L,D-TPase catalytic domain-containing protein n=1 Tax=Pseudoleptotrichia goodfellowii TaxID=157692 RepID=A0A510JCT3_9FUSO|nr:L,D-transpeptidase [Pseudoleptotrichia goodfellowii]BBM36271.1 hypothetical protein JCM16774_1203 [Pseudoleptotrichia goodfellowii]